MSRLGFEGTDGRCMQWRRERVPASACPRARAERACVDLSGSSASAIAASSAVAAGSACALPPSAGRGALRSGSSASSGFAHTSDVRTIRSSQDRLSSRSRRTLASTYETD
eukprot:15632-Pleurochrysis_carterae.AAC.2